MNRAYLLTILFIGFSVSTLTGQILINEVLSKNETGLIDQFGNHSDWIELYNPSEEPFDLNNYSLSDDSDNLQKWVLPNLTIPSKGFLLFFASAENKKNLNPAHTNFKIDADGESVYLSDPAGWLIDYIAVPPLSEDVSFGRKIDGDSEWTTFGKSTPEASNNQGQIFLGDILQFSQEPGFLNEQTAIYILGESPEMSIYYTTDGSSPNTNSTLYQDQILLEKRAPKTATISYIPTTSGWLPPKVVEVHPILQAQGFINGQAVTEPIIANYFVDPTFESSNLPTVSLTVDPIDFFDFQEGIYVEGANENFRQRGEEWERKVGIEYFDAAGNLLLNQDCGARINGNFSRKNPQKSLKLYARSSYGTSSFKYPFFGDEYLPSFDRLVLRSLHSDPFTPDISDSNLRDDLVLQIMDGQLEAASQKRFFVRVFINGEYWGIHSFRESTDDDFLANKYGIEKDNIELLENDFVPQDIQSILDRTDLIDSEKTTQILGLINEESLIEHLCVQLFFSNKDWPYNNVKIWRSEEYPSYSWINYDFDATFGSIHNGKIEVFEKGLITLEEKEVVASRLIRFLLQDPGFAARFYDRALRLNESTFSTKNTLEKLSELRAEIESEMPVHIDRWHFPKNEKTWDRAMDNLAYFLRQRPSVWIEEIERIINYDPLVIYPNPAKEAINIIFQSPTNGDLEIRVFDATGRLLLKESTEHSEGETNYYLPLPFHLPQGILFLQIETKTRVLNGKFINR